MVRGLILYINLITKVIPFDQIILSSFPTSYKSQKGLKNGQYRDANLTLVTALATLHVFLTSTYKNIYN